jgi:hypothetical protein
MSLDKLDDESSGFQKPSFNVGSQSFLNNAFDSSPDSSALKEIRNVMGTSPAEKSHDGLSSPSKTPEEVMDEPFKRKRASSAPNIHGNVHKLNGNGGHQAPSHAKSEHSINQMQSVLPESNLKKAPGLNTITEERENVAPRSKKKKRTTERCLSVDASARKNKKAKKKDSTEEPAPNRRAQSLDNLATDDHKATDDVDRSKKTSREERKSKRGRKKSKE